ncbi:MAG TPA: TIR domain-containing protein [Candidatus Omnitrophota bacterium]|nr:TIR domain-containing protein [Candidatus Omnitrophota bacterium]HPT39854.1 TIR domain-containing protein [Candidatus Omnitrophota bacterium]
MLKRVFLSFCGEDAQKVKNLLPLLNSPEYELDFYDGPLDAEIDTPAANSIKQAIGAKIAKCNLAVCLIGENTHSSKWVDSQLQKNRNKGNRIIAMALKGTQDAVLPAAIKEENLTFYPWDPPRLQKLIAEESGKLFNNSF